MGCRGWILQAWSVPALSFPHPHILQMGKLRLREWAEQVC